MSLIEQRCMCFLVIFHNSYRGQNESYCLCELNLKGIRVMNNEIEWNSHLSLSFTQHLPFISYYRRLIKQTSRFLEWGKDILSTSLNIPDINLRRQMTENVSGIFCNAFFSQSAWMYGALIWYGL